MMMTPISDISKNNVSPGEYQNIDKKFKDQYEFAQFLPVPTMFNSTNRGCVAKSPSLNFTKTDGLHTYQSCQTKAGLMYSSILRADRTKGSSRSGIYFRVVEGLYNGDPTYFEKAKTLSTGSIANLDEINMINASNGPVSVELYGYMEINKEGAITIDAFCGSRCQMWVNKTSVYDFNDQNAIINIKPGGSQTQKSSLYLFKGEKKQFRIQYQSDPVAETIDKRTQIVISPAVTYFYQVGDQSGNVVVNPNQMYFYLEENTPENTKAGMFNCYINDAYKIGEDALKFAKEPTPEVYGIWAVIDKKTERKKLHKNNYAMIDANGNFSIYNGANVVKHIFLNKKYNCSMLLNDDEARQYMINNGIAKYDGVDNSTAQVPVNNTAIAKMVGVNISDTSEGAEVEGFSLFGKKINNPFAKAKKPDPKPVPAPAPLPAPAPTPVPAPSPNPPISKTPTPIATAPAEPAQPKPPSQPEKKYSSFSDYINSFWTSDGCKTNKSPISSYRVRLASENSQVSVVVEQTTSSGDWVIISTLYAKTISNIAVNNKWREALENGTASSSIEKNKQLQGNTSLVSKDAKFCLKMNDEGNLVLYFSRQGCSNMQNTTGGSYAYSTPTSKNMFLYNVSGDEKINNMYYVQHYVDSSANSTGPDMSGGNMRDMSGNMRDMSGGTQDMSGGIIRDASGSVMRPLPRITPIDMSGGNTQDMSGGNTQDISANTPKIEPFTSNNYSNNSLRLVPQTSAILSPTDNFSFVGNYAPISANTDAPLVRSLKECNKMCIDVSSCNAFYYMKTQKGDRCQLDNIPFTNGMLNPDRVFIPQPGSSISNSELYIRNKTVNLDPVMMKKNLPVNQYVSAQQLGAFSGYTYLDDEFNTSEMVGAQTSNEGTAFFQKQNEMVNGPGASSSGGIKEGMTAADGNTKIAGLETKATNVIGQMKTIKTHRTELERGITEYKNKRDAMYNSSTNVYNETYYNFGPENKDISMLAALNEDAAELSVQEKNMMMIGSIASASLIIVSIMLARNL